MDFINLIICFGVIMINKDIAITFEQAAGIIANFPHIHLVLKYVDFLSDEVKEEIRLCFLNTFFDFINEDIGEDIKKLNGNSERLFAVALEPEQIKYIEFLTFTGCVENNIITIDEFQKFDAELMAKGVIKVDENKPH